MPAALVFFSMSVVIAVSAWLAAWRHTRNPSNQDPREDYRQLQRHAAWLEQRLDVARRERWSPEMIASLSAQLGDACQQLARARGGVIDSRMARVR